MRRGPYDGIDAPPPPPMPLAHAREPFDDPDWIFEPKWDGFRALAYIEGQHAKLISRRGHTFTSWPYLCTELAHAVRCRNAILDGEICCLAAYGRSQFNSLLFRRDWPYFLAFDLLWLNGEDLRSLPLHERKRRLAGVMPQVESRVRYVDHLRGRGVDLFRAACKHDLEGTVAKWRDGTYQTGPHTSWLKIRNPEYTQWDGRRDLFEARRDHAARRDRWARPELALK